MSIMKKITLLFLFFLSRSSLQAQVPTVFGWNSYSCGSTASLHTYTYTQTVNGVRMDAYVLHPAGSGWTSAIQTCASTYTSPGFNSGYGGITNGLVLSTDRGSSGPSAPTPTLTIQFTPALCGPLTFSIGDINGTDASFRDSIRINAWDGVGSSISMTAGMDLSTRAGYAQFATGGNLIVYGNGYDNGFADQFSISSSKISKISIVYYSGKKDYNNNPIANPTEQHIVISGFKGNAPPTVGATFACNTNSTTVNLIGSASNTTTTPTASTYTWTTSTGTINSGSNALTANVKSPGSYTLTAYNGAVALGCLSQTVISLSSVNCSLLPIELTDFNARVKDKNIQVNWETYSEKNSDYFILERSADGIEFESLYQLPSAKNSNQNKVYQYLDENPFPNINYYRLKLVDADGSFRYSKMIDVTLEAEKILVSNIKPNPTKDRIYYDVHSSKKINAQIELLDFKGLSVMEEYKYFEEGKTTESIDLSNLSQGVYVLKISSANSELKSYTKIIKN